jgi:hypothetical protein
MENGDHGMALPVVAGATLACTFGMTPSALVVLPEAGVLVENRPAATIMDHIATENILPFGMCACPANPTVAAATAAAAGVLTPQPCLPATLSPWLPGTLSVLIGNLPALDNLSRCLCTWGGVISIISPGTVQTMLPQPGAPV